MTKTLKYKKFYKICRILSCVVIVPLLAIVIFSLIISFGAKSNNGVPSMFGVCAMEIKQDTMLPEYKKGDKVLIKKVNPSDLEVGDKVAYYEYIDEQDSEKSLSEVHFNVIVEIKQSGNLADLHNGKLFFKFQGTNSETAEEGWILQDFVVGRLQSSNGFVENLFVFISSTVGVILCVLLPLAIYLFYIC